MALKTDRQDVLRFEKVGKSFFGNRVLKDISFTLEKGKILGLVGENGAGKSTMMKILFSMDDIRETGGYEGAIYLDGAKLNFNNPMDAINAGIGMVHQEFSLIPGFTATENILLNREFTKKNVISRVLGRKLDTLDRHRMHLSAKEVIELLGVNLDPDMLVSNMPVGHKQFVEISREVNREKVKVLIFDEPTAVLTEIEAQILLKALRTLADRGVAIIFISHRLQEIIDVCDSVVVLRDGELVKNIQRGEGYSVIQLAKLMVGRDVEHRAATRKRTIEKDRSVDSSTAATATDHNSSGDSSSSSDSGDSISSSNSGNSGDSVSVDSSAATATDHSSSDTDVAGVSDVYSAHATATATDSNADGDILMDIKNLWVNMAGELVNDVNLRIRRGEFLGIGGLAGQGKLGIPNGIMGLAEAGGTITYDGKVFTLNSPKSALDLKLAFVSEDRRGFGLLLDEPVYWNVTFSSMQVLDKYLKRYLGIRLRNDKEMRDKTKEYIKSLEIRCVSEKQKVRELSGGNQQKVCLARAFDLEPKLLFVSEPTRGIDIGAKSLVLQALRRYNEENGVTVVMVSSELEELRSICDRIAVICNGTVAGILNAGEDSEKFGLLMSGLG